MVRIHVLALNGKVSLTVDDGSFVDDSACIMQTRLFVSLRSTRA